MNAVLKNIRGTVAIVDGYRIGSAFAPRLIERGYKCVHIQSSLEMNPRFISTFRSQDYIADIVYDNNFGELTRFLKEHNVKCVIAGHEHGVELADELSEAIGVATNGTRLSKARRNKYIMYNAVRDYGLDVANYCIVKNLTELMNYVEKIDEWPLVIKPLDSSGAEGVSVCFSTQEAVIAFKKIVNIKNYLMRENKEILIQHYINGLDYMVNTVSLDGKHFISDSWYCKKDRQESQVIFDYFKILSPDEENIKAISSYLFGVLNALEVSYGAAHNEITLTKNGPLLLETGTRLMGSISPDWISESLGINQLDLTIDSYLDPEAFLEKVSKPVKLKQHLLVKFLKPCVEGTVKAIKNAEKIKKLPSFYALKLGTKIGSHIRKRYEVFSLPGLVVLMHENDDVVMHDYEQLRDFEMTMFEV